MYSKKIHNFPKDQNAVLVGLPGSGKTTLGKCLAQRMGMGFLDLDQAIEKFEKKKLFEVWEEKGESYFRDLESRSVAALSGLRNHVLAVGGGALQNDENLSVIKALGLLVWLDVPPNVIAQRLRADRSLLKNRLPLADLIEEQEKDRRFDRLRARLEALQGQRNVRYNMSTLVLRDSSSAPEDCARRVLYLINRHCAKNSRQ
ncbi:MAG: shikimate kinase [Deltaproteobacteria bacterium]|nr:shikimate kinase [Deltaproteobacteria bacterium]